MQDRVNWEREIETYRAALLQQLTYVSAGIGLTRGDSVPRLSKVLYLSALWVLRPLQSALRRLIVMRAEGLTVTPRPARAAPEKPIPRGSGKRLPSFPLFDPVRRSGSGRRFAKTARMTIFGYDDDDRQAEDQPAAPSDDRDARRLCQRIEMLFRVLEDLSKQARRLARWRARQASGKSERRSPLRAGRPPGFRQRARHPVDEILRECDTLVRMARRPPI